MRINLILWILKSNSYEAKLKAEQGINLILWILKFNKFVVDETNYTCINLILWILKSKTKKKKIIKSRYKFDPMDFEMPPNQNTISLT